MDFAKTTLAVACGIILVPILICSGCLFIGGVGTTAVVGTGVGVVKSAADAMVKANEQRTQQARRIVSLDEKRYADETASYDAAMQSYEEAMRGVNEAKQAMQNWQAVNPKPERPVFEKMTWWALGKKTSIEAKLLDVNEDSVKLEKPDNTSVLVPIEKLAAESRIHAQQCHEAMQSAIVKLAEWESERSRMEAAIATAQAALPQVPVIPSPITTLHEAMQQLTQPPVSDSVE